MEEVVADAHATTTFYLTLLSAFSVLALLLAGVGLYGVVAYTVSQRTREIGIRIALGAASDEVVSMILRQGIRPAMMGIVVGLATAWYAAKALGSMLYGVDPQDPLTLLIVTGILLRARCGRSRQVPGLQPLGLTLCPMP
jgi:putative ABC transport system permease protein